ncbi:MAG: SCP2 sterol-binding domain-containing protein [Xanthomonadales bacterium]|nr:SCP2 sterol-binding domain-containing protein [Xanthomonadales bacterium]
MLAALARVLEAALNRALALDAETTQALAGLDGRDLVIDFRHGLPALRLWVEGRRLRAGRAIRDGDLRISATPGSFLALALARRFGIEAGAAAGRVGIAGDAELARRVADLATRFEPDIEEGFTRAFGDVAGVQLARLVRGALERARHSARHLAEDGAAFLTEEGRDLVARAELEAFFDDVEDLAARSDRLQARIRRLAAAGGAAAP